jgi:hypothetical protein
MKTLLLILVLSLSAFSLTIQNATSKKLNTTFGYLDTTETGLYIKNGAGDTITTFDDSYKKLDSINEQITVTTGDDYGVIFSDQVSVLGELIAGRDSNPIEGAWHCQIANTTDKVITGCTDVSTILMSDNGSVTGMFGGTTAGSYLLIASTEPAEGQKVKYDALATVEPGNVLGQAFISDLAGWQSAPRMGTNASPPYNSNAWEISKHLSEQIFYGFNPLTRDLPDQWLENTFTINGVDSTAFFSRLIVISPISGDPQVEQIKIHTDRIEVEAGGIFKYGRARSPVELNLDVKESTTAPRDGTFTLTPQSDVKGKKNRFQAGATDRVVYSMERVWGLDTSVPIVLEIGYFVDGPATGTLEFTVEISQVKNGFVFDGTEPYLTDTLTIPIPSAIDEVQQTLDILVPVQELSSNATVFVTLTRAAGQGGDNLAQDIIVTLERAFGYSWKI